MIKHSDSLLGAIGILNDVLDDMNLDYHVHGYPDQEVLFIRAETLLKAISAIQEAFDADEKSFCKEQGITWMPKNQLN